ncbi:MAG: phosphatidate cytidylyltransferase [Pseudomonadota bacterium]
MTPEKNLLVRLVVSAIGIPVVFGALFQPSPTWTWLLVMAVLLAAFEEYGRILGLRALERWVNTGVGVVLWAVVYWRPDALLPCLFFSTIVIFSSFFAISGRDPARAFRRTTESVFALVYLGLLVCIPLLRRDGGDNGTLWVILLVTTVWFEDTLVYFAWLFLGGHRDYPDLGPSFRGRLARIYRSLPVPSEISRNKSWGAFPVQFAGCLIANLLGKLFYLPTLTWGQVLALSFLAALLGKVGDLCESMLKRAFGAGTSGPFLPGHGGILDRIDALLFVAPLYYFFVRWWLP